MSAIADALRRLGALSLDHAAMKAVLAIVADMESAHGQEIASLKAELATLKGKQKRKRNADAKRLREKREAARVAAESRDMESDTVGRWGDKVAPESRDISSDSSATVAAPPSPAPLPSSSPPYPPNNYLPPTPIPDDDDARACAKPAKSMISEEAHAIAEAIGREAGHSLAAWPSGWCGAAYLVQKFLDDGCPGEIVKLGAVTALRRKRDGAPDNFAYFEKPIAAAFANHKRPLPTIVAREGHIIEVPHAPRKRTIIDAGLDLIAEADEQATRGSAGNALARLLPPERRD